MRVIEKIQGAYWTLVQHASLDAPQKQIAAELGIVERIVKVHRAQVMYKTGAASLADLVRFAERLQGGV